MSQPQIENLRFRWPVEVSLIFCVVIWGTNFVILKAALPTMHEQALNFFRLLAALVALGWVHIWFTRRRGVGFLHGMSSNPWRIIATGILGYTIYQIAFIVGLDNTTSGSAALIMASAPIWTAMLAVLLRLERLRLAAWGGLVISLAGTAFIIVTGQRVALGEEALYGNLMMLLAAMGWAAYTVLNRPLLKHVPAVSLTFYGILFSITPLAVVSLPYFEGIDWGGIRPIVWFAIAFSGAFSTGLTVVLWNDAVRRIGPSRTAVFSNLVPVIALITGVVFLGEHLRLGQVVGGALVIAGLLTVRASGKKNGDRQNRPE